MWPEFVENTTMSDLVEVLEEEQVLDRLKSAILDRLWHVSAECGSDYACARTGAVGVAPGGSERGAGKRRGKGLLCFGACLLYINLRP